MNKRSVAFSVCNCRNVHAYFASRRKHRRRRGVKRFTRNKVLKIMHPVWDEVNFGKVLSFMHSMHDNSLINSKCP